MIENNKIGFLKYSTCKTVGAIKLSNITTINIDVDNKCLLYINSKLLLKFSKLSNDDIKDIIEQIVLNIEFYSDSDLNLNDIIKCKGALIE